MLKRSLPWLVGVIALLPTPALAAAPAPTACTINPEAPATFNVGVLGTYFVTTTGCASSTKVVRFKVVRGSIPPGMTLFTQGVTSAGITGTPTTEGVFQFTLQARDETGIRDRESFQITVAPPLPLTITNQSGVLSPGSVGAFYCCGNLFAFGGVQPYSWSLAAGLLPPGLSLTTSPGLISGTPTVAGTFSFTVRVTDSQGVFTERVFSITIS